MIVKMKSISEVTPYADNPRVIPKEAVQAIANSIDLFGWQQPVVIDKDGVIVAGHGRYQAAKKLGLSAIPVAVATDLDEASVRAFRIADNRIKSLSRWDGNTLFSEISDLVDISQSWGETLTGLGFDPSEVEISAIDETPIVTGETTDEYLPPSDKYDRTGSLTLHFHTQEGMDEVMALLRDFGMKINAQSKTQNTHTATWPTQERVDALQTDAYIP